MFCMLVVDKQSKLKSSSKLSLSDIVAEALNFTAAELIYTSVKLFMTPCAFQYAPPV